MGEEELLAALQDFIRRWAVPSTNAYSLTSLRQYGKNAQPGNTEYRGQLARLKRDLTETGLADRIFQRYRGVAAPGASRAEQAAEAKRVARLAKQEEAQRVASSKVDDFLKRWGGYGSTSVMPQRGAAPGSSLLEWGREKHALKLPEFEAAFTDVTRLARMGGDPVAMMQDLAGAPRHLINWRPTPVDFSTAGGPLDLAALESGVRDVEARTTARARRLGVFPKGFKSPLVPGGRQLGWAVNDEVRADLARAWGIESVLDQIGAPSVVKPGEQTAAGLVYVGDPAKAEGRAYMRFAIEREELMETQDPRLIYKALVTLQDRTERTAMYGTGPAQRYLLSGQQPTWDTVQQVMRQRDLFRNGGGIAADPKAYSLVFDLETMSLQPEHGIREISARFIDDAGNEVREAINIHLAHGMHGLGAHGRPLHEVYGIQPSQLRPQSEYIKSVTEFFEAANDAKFVIAQNNNFDIGMLARVKDEAMYDLGMRLIKRGQEAVGPEEEMALRLAKATNLFFEGVGTDRYIDTSAHLKLIFSKLDGRTVSVASELEKLGDMKQYSVANAMLQTSALDDILAHGLATPAEVQEQLGGALHSGFVDTWWTKHLVTLIKKAEAGEDVLRPQELGSDELLGRLNVGLTEPLTRVGLREKFTQGSAYTITSTHLQPKDLKMLEDMDIISRADRLSGRMKITPLDQMMLLQRHATYDPVTKAWQKAGGGFLGPSAKNADLNQVDAMKVRGKWDEFATKHSLMLKSGRINPMADFYAAADEYGAFQKTLEDANIPFARMSMTERMLSTALGRGRVEGLSAAENQVRRALGEVAPVLYWQTFAGLEGQKGVGKFGVNAVIAPDLLKRIGLYDEDSLLSVSPFEYSAGGPKDFALTLDLISQDKDEGTRQIQDIISRLQGLTDDEKALYGVTEQSLDDLGTALRATGHTAGIQIGTIGGGTGTTEATAAFHAFDSIDATVDRTRGRFVVGRLGEMVEGTGGQKYLRTTGFFSSAGGVLDREHAAMLEETKRLAGGTDEMYKAISGDPRLLAELGEKPRHAGPLADFFVDAYNKARPHLTGKKMGIAAGLGAAAFFFYKASRPKPGQEVMEQQAFEDANFYGRYRSDMGQPYKEPIALMHQKPDPLETAHIPSYLHDNKTRHHEMGASKNNHLYAGAY